MLVDPLAYRRTLPPEAHWELLPLDGWPIRTVRWAGRERGRGSLLFIGGRADFIEKYSEAYWTWVADWGVGVATFDWRGQGLSGRLGGDPHKGHGDFDRWTQDLGLIVAWFTASLPGPHFIVAHSMGGHLALRYLMREQGPIERAALLAPMLGIRTAPIGSRLVARLAKLATGLGWSGRYGFLQHGYDERQQRAARQALLTACADRFADEHWWIETEPALALGGVTWGWLASAFRSIDMLLADGALERIATPLLLMAGEHERLVDLGAIGRAAARLPDCRFEVVPDGRHELLRDIEVVRSATQFGIRRFLLEPAL